MYQEIIRKAYYNPETGFTGLNKLFKQLKKDGHDISRNEIKNFLKEQEIYQTTKKSTQHVSFVPPYPLYEFQADLIYLEDKHLNKASYGLVCIDTFSKKGDVELIKKKDGRNVAEAMNKILNRMGIPEFLYVDEGSEFNNAQFKQLMNENNIELILSLRHATIVERFNRTLKELLYKYLQSTNTKTITNVLPKILSNYNNSYHKTIEMSPNEVNESNKEQVLANILSKANRKKREKIVAGDHVRVQLKRKGFDKGYNPKYSKEIYTVDRREGKYYFIQGLARKYLRAFIEKVRRSYKNPVKADLDGTREGHVKNLARRQVDVVNTLPAPRPKRERRKPDRLTY